MRPLRLRARWILPIASGAIADGALLTDSDGRIAAVGSTQEIPESADAETLDLGDAVLFPGLVNTHTHLELTGFDPIEPGTDFRQWIVGLRQQKQKTTTDRFREAAKEGLRDCWRAGVTTIADTGDSGAALDALLELGGSGIAYLEVFGPHPNQLDASFGDLVARTSSARARAHGRVRVGVSPHAPYTVSGPLYRRVAEWAREEKLPVAVHIAESPAEHAFVSRGTGPFAEGWQARGIPPLTDATHHPSLLPSFPPSPIGWLDHHGVLGARTLCIHAIQLDTDDLSCLATRQAAVAHCPLSNRAHGHGDAPLRDLLDHGIRVGLGTDSVASIGPLDLMAEARAARALAGLSAGETVALATLRGAEALGLAGETGSLTPGKWGDVAAVQLPPGSEDPAEAVLASGPANVVLTCLGGRVVHRQDRTA